MKLPCVHEAVCKTALEGECYSIGWQHLQCSFYTPSLLPVLKRWREILISRSVRAYHCKVCATIQQMINKYNYDTRADLLLEIIAHMEREK